MALSQNGWSANDRSVITTIPVPGGTLSVRKGDVAVIFEWLARRFNDDVEHLVWPGCWGYAERNIRGSATAVSNHASGTAVDFNAPKHPLGKVGTFSRTQVRAIRRILHDADGVIRWGGDYSSRKDEMHFEINASAARVAALARTLEDDMPTADEIAKATVDRLLSARLKNAHNDIEASFAAWLVYTNEKSGQARDNSANSLAATNLLRDSLAATITDAVKTALADGTIKVDITVNGAKS